MLVTVEAVDPRAGAVAQQEAVAHQVLLDRRDRAEHTFVVAGGRKPTRGITSRLASTSRVS